MDQYTTLASGVGLGSTTTLVIYFLYRIFSAFNGHRVVSDCCGRKGELGFVVRDMPPTPPTETRNLPLLDHSEKDAPKETPSAVAPEVQERPVVLEIA